MHHRIATRIFVEAGGLDLLAAYGIEAGDDPLYAFTAGRYPNKDGTKMTNIGGGAIAFLLVQDGSILLHAGIGQPAGALPSNIQVKSGMLLTGKYGLKDNFSDLVIRSFGAARPMLAYSISKAYPRAFSQVVPTMDEQIFTLSGEMGLTIDRSRVSIILDFLHEHGAADPKAGFALHCLKRDLNTNERQGGAEVMEGHRLWGAASRNVLGITGRAKKDEVTERFERVARLIANMPDLPDSSDPSWDIALRMLKLDAENAKMNQGEAE